MKKHTRPAFAGRGINFLTREQMEKIHSATLQLMQETGIVVQHKGALELLEKAGCRVVKKHVYFTPSIVEWAIKAAPSTAEAAAEWQALEEFLYDYGAASVLGHYSDVSATAVGVEGFNYFNFPIYWNVKVPA